MTPTLEGQAVLPAAPWGAGTSRERDAALSPLCGHLPCARGVLVRYFLKKEKMLKMASSAPR